MARRGRQTKFDEERAKSILTDLAAGNTRACAAARAGIGERTLVTWMAEGKKGKEPFAAFSASVKKAERDAEAESVRIILEAGLTSWTARAWWLERKFQRDWSANRNEVKELRKEIAALMDRLSQLAGEPGARGGTQTGAAGGAGTRPARGKPPPGRTPPG